MFEWGAQWYGYVPRWVNRNVNRSPEWRRGESNPPVSLVTVWSFVSPLSHVTVAFARTTVKFRGVYGSAAFGALGTMRMSTGCPPGARMFVIRGETATPTIRLPR